MAKVFQDAHCVKLFDEWTTRTKAPNPEMGADGQGSQFLLETYDQFETVERQFDVQVSSGGYLYLVWRSSREEVTLRVSGFVSQMSLLPPFRRSFRLPRGNPNLALQTVVVASEGPAFRRAITARSNILRFMEMHACHGTTSVIDDVWLGAMPCFIAETRVLTPMVEAPLFDSADLNMVIDPYGALAELVAGGRLSWTSDNVVSCMELKGEYDDRWSTPVQSSLDMVRAGELVELSVNFRLREHVSPNGANVGRKFLTRLDTVMIVSRLGMKLIADCESEHLSMMRIAAAADNTGGDKAPKKRRFSYLQSVPSVLTSTEQHLNSLTVLDKTDDVDQVMKPVG
ncbi:hypothetical protein SCP_0801640 [Sparassis crispa]|uniref:Uncharacterized protein n=1 Tax=Sparassis crispa TaxID=139825 RepID=A0A401GV77_9APHY|nr:hypothetical protein SCP_0801640 [Sparassis crispa]GBE85644.1 hypothetical protein SCP_0801640 [Sparassis crispa]